MKKSSSKTIRAIIDFMSIAEGLKRELRHIWLSDGRQESVAEHTWSMTLLAMMLLEEVSLKLDQLKVIKMIIIHDLVEAVAGDQPHHDDNKKRLATKLKNEKLAMQKLKQALVSKRLANEIEKLWLEFEALETNEAKFAQACDKADAVIQHNLSDISTFSQGDYDMNPYYKDELFNFDRFIRGFKDQIDIDNMKKMEQEGDISRVQAKHLKRWQDMKK